MASVGGGVVLMLGAGLRIFVALEPIDMRGSFDFLAGHAAAWGWSRPTATSTSSSIGGSDSVRAIWFDGSGWMLLSKRLVAGSFELPAAEEGADKVVVDAATLWSLLEGIDLAARRRRW